MFSKSKSSQLLMILMTSALIFAPQVAMAQTIGEIAYNVVTSLIGVTALAGAIGYAVGFFFVLGAIFKFKQHGDNPEQYTLRAPIFLMICAVLAVYMTAVLTTGKETIWGAGGAQTQGVDGAGTGAGL